MSVTSRATGPENKPDSSLTIHLEHARAHHLGWAIFGLGLGGLLLWKLGAIGQGLGVIFICIGAYAGHGFVRTLRREAGTVRVAHCE